MTLADEHHALARGEQRGEASGRILGEELGSVVWTASDTAERILTPRP